MNLFETCADAAMVFEPLRILGQRLTPDDRSQD
jgi:hypothetical protein